MRHLQAVVVSLGLLMTMSANAKKIANRQTPPLRPNIIFILTDDLDAGSAAFMPRLKALLIDQGVSFSNFFVSFSLCCPSRATILRGQYAHNTQILGNRPPDGGFEKFYSLGEENSTIATWLQAAGYRTMYVGKYLNGYPGDAALTYVPPGWDEWYSAVKGNPYSEYNYTLNENGKLVSYGNTPEDYGTDVYARKAVDFIQRTAKEGKPFFIHLSVYAPHGPATPAPRHENLFPNAQAPRTPNFNEEDVSDKPAYIRNRPPLTSREIVQIDEQYRERLQSLQAVDDAIASLIDTLNATGQLDKTYIFFTSDNGFHLGNHRLALGKVAPYEEDIRVPLIVRGPGVPAGQTREHLVGNVDLAPTWAELAGAQAPAFVDGRSLVPLLGEIPPSPESWRQAFLLENGDLAAQTRVLTTEPGDFARQIREAGIPPFRGLRTKDYLYVEYNTGERELYDLTHDPYELENLVSTADPALLKRLSSWLAELRRCAGASCRAAETAPLFQRQLPSGSQLSVLNHPICSAVFPDGLNHTGSLLWQRPRASSGARNAAGIAGLYRNGGAKMERQRLTLSAALIIWSLPGASAVVNLGIDAPRVPITKATAGISVENAEHLMLGSLPVFVGELLLNQRSPRQQLYSSDDVKVLDITIDPENNQGTFDSLNGAYGSGYSPQPDFPHVSDLLKAAGIKFLRFPQDDGFDFTLATMFPNENAPADSLSSYNFAGMDRYMQEIEKTGAGLIWTALYDIGGGDRWVGPANFQGGRCPRNPDQWAQVVVNVIRHFNDGWGAERIIPVQYVECLNEPLGLGGCSLSDYLDVYKAFSLAVSGYNSGSTRPVKLIGFGEPVHLTSNGQGPDPTKLPLFREFVDYVNRNGLSLDMVSIHPYEDSPYKVYQLARLYREAMDNAGWEDKDLILTEYGSISSLARSDDDLNTLSRKLAAFQTVVKIFLQGTVKIATGDRVVPSGYPYKKPYKRLGGTLFFTNDRRMLPAIQAVKMLTILEESFPTIVYRIEPNEQNIAVIALKSNDNARLAILVANSSWDTWQLDLDIKSFSSFRNAVEYSFGDGDITIRSLPLEAVKGGYRIQPFDVRVIILER